MKVDFRKIKIETITGEFIENDLSQLIGNMIYGQSKDLGEVEFARELYLNGEVEIDDKKRELVENTIKGFGYVAKTAIQNAMKE